MECEDRVSFKYFLGKSTVSTPQMSDIDILLLVIVIIDGVESPKKGSLVDWKGSIPVKRSLIFKLVEEFVPILF